MQFNLNFMAPKGILKDSAAEKSEIKKTVNFKEEQEIIEFEKQKDDAPSSGETIEAEETPPASPLEDMQEKPRTSVAEKRGQQLDSAILHDSKTDASSNSAPPPKLQRTKSQAGTGKTR